MHLNIEFKAECSDPNKIRDLLSQMGADYIGRDHQRDIYFNVLDGRLKLRRGNIESNLIYYQRDNKSGPKQADVNLFQVDRKNAEDLESLLKTALGIRVIVDKQRDIYFIENVKFHLDLVRDLGSFMEVEAIDKEGKIGVDKLREQCDRYIKLFDIKPEDLVSKSYSDLLLEKKI